MTEFLNNLREGDVVQVVYEPDCIRTHIITRITPSGAMKVNGDWLRGGKNKRGYYLVQAKTEH